TTRPRAANAAPSHTPATIMPSVSCAARLQWSARISAIASSTAGAPASSASRKTRFSWVSGRRRRRFVTVGSASEPVTFEAPVERAAREPERAGGVADVAVVTLERALDEHALHLVERELLERRGPGIGGTQAEIAGVQLRVARQQHRALHRVLQLAHVAGPGMRQQRLDRRRVEALQGLAIAPRVAFQEVRGERGNVLAA